MSQHRRLVLRFSLLFRASPCESFRLLRNDTDSGISYPNQHIDSECLLRTCYFRASVHYDTLRRQCFSSSIDGRAIRLPSEGMHHEHLCLRSSCKAKHAAWGAIDLAFRIFHAGDLFFCHFHMEKRFLFPGRTLRRRFSVVSRRSAFTNRRHQATHFDDGKVLLVSLAHRRRSRGSTALFL